VSQSVAQRMFPNQDAVNHHLMWTDPVMKFIGVTEAPRRIVGVVADLDDEHVVPGPALTVYHPFDQEDLWSGRLFVHAGADPYGLVRPITRILREMSPDQPVEHAATLEDVRAEVLTPDRLNVLVFGVFAGVALLIAVVGVAGVLAFSVSGRTREFGIRLAIGSQPRHLLTGVIAEGAAMAIGGLVVGAGLGIGLATLAGRYFGEVKTPGFLPVAASALVLLLAAVIASVLPAARAARVDVLQALRSD
jgi:putative ABC transport system permease protein